MAKRHSKHAFWLESVEYGSGRFGVVYFLGQQQNEQIYSHSTGTKMHVNTYSNVLQILVRTMKVGLNIYIRWDYVDFQRSDTLTLDRMEWIKDVWGNMPPGEACKALVWPADINQKHTRDQEKHNI